MIINCSKTITLNTTTDDNCHQRVRKNPVTQIAERYSD